MRLRFQLPALAMCMIRSVSLAALPPSSIEVYPWFVATDQDFGFAAGYDGAKIRGTPQEEDTDVLFIYLNDDEEPVDSGIFTRIATIPLTVMDRMLFVRATQTGHTVRHRLVVGEFLLNSSSKTRIVVMFEQLATPLWCEDQCGPSTTASMMLPLVSGADLESSVEFVTMVQEWVESAQWNPSTGQWSGGPGECHAVDMMATAALWVGCWDCRPPSQPPGHQGPCPPGWMAVPIRQCVSYDPVCLGNGAKFCEDQYKECLDDIFGGLFPQLIAGCFAQCRNVSDPGAKAACVGGCVIASIPLSYCTLWELIGRFAYCGLEFDGCMRAGPSRCCLVWTDKIICVDPMNHTH